MDGESPYALERLWVVFFRRRAPHWWFDRLIDPGFRHVSAAAWYPAADRWVFYDPAARATALLVLPDGPEANGLFGQWACEASAVLRVRSRDKERPMMPPFFGCVAAMKALLGVHCRALSPKQLHDHLLARGAEIVPVPRSEHGEPVQA